MKVKKIRAGNLSPAEKTRAQESLEHYHNTKSIFMNEVLDTADLEPTNYTYLSNFAPTNEEEAFYNKVVTRVRRAWLKDISDRLEQPLPKIIAFLAEC